MNITTPKTLQIRTSPHIVRGLHTHDIMRNVVLALLPVAAFAIYAFGLAALLVLSVATFSCVLTEHLICRLTGKDTTVGDWSAAISGMLYGLTLPPGLPLWMVAFGGIIGIAVGKALFGGLGQNAFNPALVGRAITQAAFPVAITTWYPAFAVERFQSLPSSTLALPFMQPVWDAVTTATPLGTMKFEKQITATYDLVMGFTSGSLGETSSLFILAGGFYLAARRMLNWRIPAAVLGTVAALSGIFHWIDPQEFAGPMFMLFSGGLMLGAVYMATDMVASPMTSKGVVLYGALIGVLIVVIRYWGGLPEGVMYAILVANAVSPHIDSWIQPRVYGTKLKKEADLRQEQIQTESATR
ncbi:MAG: RnfABCDGE type electron transport complex subunit D [Deferribacteres bacterium]|nr:RnfABCDGE type electron transport complex subunit D [Deferribacteres bacterium]